jgi:hypothetical protein
MKPQIPSQNQKPTSVSRPAAAADLNQSEIDFVQSEEEVPIRTSFDVVKRPNPHQMTVEEAVQVWRNEGDPN